MIPKRMSIKIIPDNQGVSTIPYNRSNKVIAMNIPSIIQIPYFCRKIPGLRVAFVNFCMKSPINGKGQIKHHILPKRMKVRGINGHHKVQAKIEPGLLA